MLYIGVDTAMLNLFFMNYNFDYKRIKYRETLDSHSYCKNLELTLKQSIIHHLVAAYPTDRFHQ